MQAIVIAFLLAGAAAAGTEEPDLAENTRRWRGAVDAITAGRLAEAEATLRSIIEQFATSPVRSTADGRASHVAALDLLGATLHLQGRSREAEPLIRDALAASERRSEREVESLTLLATVLVDRGEMAEAERLSARALSVGEHLWGKYSAKLVTSLNTLAEVRLARHDFTAAEALLRRATRLASQPGGTPLLQVAVMVRRGLLWLAMGRYHEAEPALERALAMAEENVAPDHPTLRPLAHILARCYRLRNRPEDAAVLEGRVAAMGSAIHGASFAQGGR